MNKNGRKTVVFGVATSKQLDMSAVVLAIANKIKKEVVKDDDRRKKVH